MTARDEAGNVRQREAPLRIANGGIERVEIAEARSSRGGCGSASG